MEQAESEGSFSDNGTDYDAIVVGSGYGGSVAACRMSMAGVKVCLVEKGRRWQSQDFPTDTTKIISATRIENKNLGITVGPKDALFQIYQQEDSLAAVACGLGGGSLVNAGVMIPTPVRAKRNPKWPKEWERDWEICEASASAMLRIQDVPLQFASAKIMEKIVGEEFEETHPGSLKLSVNFDSEERSFNSMETREIDSCLACGNCLSGCPYNAKSSTDKTYLASAVQAGCIIKTECEVQYVVQNPDYICKQDEVNGKRGARRWLVFLNEIDHLTSDYVVLSAGVFGTSKILFQSQLRGLKLSERIGSGFSCNGNNVAYLAGSPAPLNAYGLDRKSFSKVAFAERPGPSISSSYTSSLGFTIQSAVLPTSYPYLLFKGITTYGWPSCFWFLYGVIDKLKYMVGIRSSKAMILNAMGYDNSDGKITFDSDTNTILFRPPRDLLLPRKIEAFQKLTKKLGGVLFMARYRSASVHLLGGCNASSDPSNGVCNPKGQVFDTKSHTSVHDVLYVCDASLIPCSIGVNPCLTITTLAEHVSKHLVEDILRHNLKEGTVLIDEQKHPKQGSITSLKLNHSGVVFRETMRGFVGGMPCTAYLKLHMNYMAPKKRKEKIELLQLSHPSLLRGKVSGYVVCIALEIGKLHIIDGEVNLCEVDDKTPYTQYMHYRLLLAASSGSRYILEGNKVLNPYLFGLYAWREATELLITLRKVTADTSEEKMLKLKGKLNISFLELLKSLVSLKGEMRLRFISLLLQTLFRTYISQVPRGLHKDLNTLKSRKRLYPNDTLHEIQTEDGFTISCRQWKCKRNMLTVEGKEEITSPVLLINGYSTECYCLPTEENDLVRTLLDEGYETWLLQPRLHPLNASNSFTIDDIGRFDIPAVIDKICGFHGLSTKVHVVAHCVGGLAIHIALMGGYVSASRIASLSCTNSSMFFKLTASSRFKMWLPLIPISMKILGKNKVLPLLNSSKASSRHRLLRSVARLIPRCERCTCDECEVFSGIFGNTFWHNNITTTMHYWLNKESLPILPMAAFPHLRKICNAGCIVDSKGGNSYLMHPERMALATLYISGERTLLVTPQTSFLANNYMKLHQPGFRHERVVVEGFGHSDLLIGKESSGKVFPHILSHIRLAERGNVVAVVGNRSKLEKEALSWGDHPFEEGCVGLLCLSSLFLALLCLFVVLVMFPFV